MNQVLLMSGLISVLISSTVLAAKGSDDGHDINPPPSTGNQINACVLKKKGDMRTVATSNQCNKKEYPLSWNIQGPIGDTGSAGARGEVGNAGAKGDTGSAGAKGEVGNAGAKGDTGIDGATGPEGPIGESSMPPEPYVLGDNPELGGFVIEVTPDGLNGIVIAQLDPFQFNDTHYPGVMSFLEVLNLRASTPRVDTGVYTPYYDWRLPNLHEIHKMYHANIKQHQLTEQDQITGTINDTVLSTLVLWQYDYNCRHDIYQRAINFTATNILPLRCINRKLYKRFGPITPSTELESLKLTPSWTPIIIRNF